MVERIEYDWQGMMDRIAAGDTAEPTLADDDYLYGTDQELALGLYDELETQLLDQALAVKDMLDGLCYEVNSDGAFVYVKVDGYVAMATGRAHGVRFECHITSEEEDGRYYDVAAYPIPAVEADMDGFQTWLWDTIHGLNN